MQYKFIKTTPRGNWRFARKCPRFDFTPNPDPNFVATPLVFDKKPWSLIKAIVLYIYVKVYLKEIHVKVHLLEGESEDVCLIHFCFYYFVM